MFSRAGCGGRRRTDGAQDGESLGRGEVGRDRRRLPRTREAALPCLWPSQPLVVCTATLGWPHVGSRPQGAMALDSGALAFSCGAGKPTCCPASWKPVSEAGGQRVAGHQSWGEGSSLFRLGRSWGVWGLGGLRSGVGMGRGIWQKQPS